MRNKGMFWWMLMTQAVLAGLVSLSMMAPQNDVRAVLALAVCLLSIFFVIEGLLFFAWMIGAERVMRYVEPVFGITAVLLSVTIFEASEEMKAFLGVLLIAQALVVLIFLAQLRSPVQRIIYFVVTMAISLFAFDEIHHTSSLGALAYGLIFFGVAKGLERLHIAGPLR